MEQFLMYLIITLFILLVVANVYFRVKVLKSYRSLKDLQIHFDASAVFDKNKLESEILVKHPKHRDLIYNFAVNLRRSITVAILLIVLITVFGAVLMYYRQV